MTRLLIHYPSRDNRSPLEGKLRQEVQAQVQAQNAQLDGLGPCLASLARGIDAFLDQHTRKGAADRWRIEKPPDARNRLEVWKGTRNVLIIEQTQY